MRRYKIKNKKILIFLGIVLCLMTVGYAAFYSQLNISGTSSITNSWDVEITNVTVKGTTGNGENAKTPTWDALTASMEADIYESGDSVSYEVTVSNLGTLDAKLDDITKNIRTNNEAVKIEFSGYSKGERLYKHGASGSTKTITVTISFNDEYEGTLDYNTSTETNVTFDFVQADGNNEDPDNPIPTTYELVYNYKENGGSSTTAENEYFSAGETVQLSGTASKKGYIFVGWNTNKDATTGISNITLDSDKTVYAIYKKEAVTLTAKWNANNATLSSTSNSSCTIAAVYNNATQATSCTVNAPTITAPSNTPTVVGFNTTASSTTNNSSYDKSTGKLTLTSSNTGNTWYAITMKEAITLTAKWNANGASLSSSSDKTCDLAAAYNGATQETSCTVDAPTITRSGYTIIGFNTTASSTTNNSSYDTSTKKLTLTSSNTGSTWYAVTRNNTAYTASFNANGASLTGSTSVSCYTYNTATSCTVDAPTITRSGFTIIGFNTTADSTTNNSSYNTSTGKLTLTSSNTGSTWYTVTKNNTAYTASFNANGASLSSTSQLSCYTYNTATSCTVNAPTITRSGFTIIGFNTTAASTANNSSYDTSTKKLTLTSSNTASTWYAITKKDIVVTFMVGANTAAVGASSGSCTIYNTATSCSVTTPTITPNSLYVPAGFSTTNGATTGVAPGDDITGLTANATYYGNSKADTATISITSTTTTNEITITADATAASGIDSYAYTLNGSAASCKSGTNANVCVIEGLTHNTTYSVGATVTANSGKTATTSAAALTKEIVVPTYSLTKNVVTVTFPAVSLGDNEYLTCGDGLICSYIKDNGSAVTVTSNTSGATVSSNGTLMVPVTFMAAGTIVANISDYKMVNDSPVVVNAVNASTFTFAPAAVNVSFNDTNAGLGCSDTQCALEKINIKIIDRITLSLATSSTSKSITAVASASALSDITKYEFSIDGGKTYINNGTTNTYTFNGLTHDTSYAVSVRVTAESGKIATESASATTVKIDTPTYSVNKNVVTITYPNGCTNYTCQYSTDGGTSWSTSNTDTKTVTFSTPGDVIARTSDSVNTVTASTYNFNPFANNVSYTDTNTNLGCNDVQCALEEIKEMLG